MSRVKSGSGNRCSPSKPRNSVARAKQLAATRHTAIELSQLAGRLGGFLPLPAQRSGERAGGEGFVCSGPEGASSPRPSPPLRRGEGESSFGLIPRCLNLIAVGRPRFLLALILADQKVSLVTSTPTGARVQA